jgi:hypothetical protein
MNSTLSAMRTPFSSPSHLLSLEMNSTTNPNDAKTGLRTTALVYLHWYSLSPRLSIFSYIDPQVREARARAWKSARSKSSQHSSPGTWRRSTTHCVLMLFGCHCHQGSVKFCDFRSRSISHPPGQARQALTGEWRLAAKAEAPA